MKAWAWASGAPPAQGPRVWYQGEEGFLTSSMMHHSLVRDRATHHIFPKFSKEGLGLRSGILLLWSLNTQTTWPFAATQQSPGLAWMKHQMHLVTCLRNCRNDPSPCGWWHPDSCSTAVSATSEPGAQLMAQPQEQWELLPSCLLIFLWNSCIPALLNHTPRLSLPTRTHRHVSGGFKISPSP